MAEVGKLELVAWWQYRVVPCTNLGEGTSGSWGRKARGWVAGVPNPITIDGVWEAGALPEPGCRQAKCGSSSGLPPGPALETGCLPDFQNDEPTPSVDFGIWFLGHSLVPALFLWFSMQVA